MTKHFVSAVYSDMRNLLDSCASLCSKNVVKSCEGIPWTVMISSVAEAIRLMSVGTVVHRIIADPRIISFCAVYYQLGQYLLGSGLAIVDEATVEDDNEEVLDVDPT